MLSKRLQAVADMVTPGHSVADIGTDHGYVPIYLVKNQIAPKAWAMDINAGPIARATENIAGEGLSEKIGTIQSDGMEKLERGMADTVIIAGMGGELMIHILEKAKVRGLLESGQRGGAFQEMMKEDLKGETSQGMVAEQGMREIQTQEGNTIQELVLSPHRDIDLVRKYILEMDWQIESECMVKDAGKYYTVIKAVPGREMHPYSAVEYRYGRRLLEQKDTVLKEYLAQEQKKISKILDTMRQKKSKDIEMMEQILAYNKCGREICCPEA